MSESKQIKEFWEWCGLTTNYVDGIQYWYNSQGNYIGHGFQEWTPKINLNNLFKYISSMLRSQNFKISFVTCVETLNLYPIRCEISKWNGLDIDLDIDVYWTNIAWKWGNTYEEALFEALLEVKNKQLL